MKYVVPVAGRRGEACEALSESIAKHHLTSREVGDLYKAWRDGSRDVRRRVLESPELFLRARREVEESPVQVRPGKVLLQDLELVGKLARRAERKWREGSEGMSLDEAAGVKLSYPALTAFCRRSGIGEKPAVPAGQYTFQPGQECQHDTSPHEVVIGGKKRLVQTASAVLCYSRMIFFQCVPRFQRFECKAFLTDALQYFGGSTERIMIDNTHVVVLKGTGADMVPVPEMEAFGERYGFTFVAHEVGDANRSAREEGPFHYIERNFFPGRTFSDWADLNAQAPTCCGQRTR